MRCRGCSAEAADAQFCDRCGAPAAQQPSVAADPGTYVPGSAGNVPVYIRRVLRGYTGMASGAVAGAVVGACAVSVLSLPRGHHAWDELVGDAWGMFFVLFALAVRELVRRIRFSRLLRRPGNACSATVVACERGERTVILDAPWDGYRSDLKVSLAWWTKARMLLPGENVTVYGRPGGVGTLLVSSSGRSRAFLGTGTRVVSRSSRARPGQQPSKSAPDSAADSAIFAEWVQTRKFSTRRLPPGYDKKEVDAFLDAIRATFLGVREPSLTPDDIRNKQFSTTGLLGGYDEAEVDAVLDEAELRLAAQIYARGEAPSRSWSSPRSSGS